ncbi:hypothetical protein ACWDTP_31390 [Mycobacterium sp. NPDC003449]
MAEPAAAPGVAAFPAPGSAVPGAPPALRRALSPADGVSVAAADAREAPAAEPVPSGPGASGGSRFTAAAALLGVALGLELAGVIAHGAGRSRRSMLT